MIHVAGIDIGSTYSKAVLIDEHGNVVGRGVRRTGFKLAQASEAVFDELVANAGVARTDVTYVASTGYGRHTVPFRNTQLTELTAHAHAAVHLFPDTRTILDIGGQDIKAIRVDGDGRVKAFRLNDKCAAGTGAFLEKTARYLGLTTDDIGPYASRSTNPKPVSSVCAVFAESEVISHLASGVPAEDIMMGAMVALGGRAVQLMRRVGLEPGYMLTGGMTRNVAMIKALEENLKDTLRVAPDGLGQLNGALGAALLGLRRVQKLIAEGRPIAAVQTPADGEHAKRRRWSAIAVRRTEPCRGDGCSVATKLQPRPSAVAA
jgi:predicted CoA-substrate-specific enzyme activase